MSPAISRRSSGTWPRCLGRDDVRPRAASVARRRAPRADRSRDRPAACRNGRRHAGTPRAPPSSACTWAVSFAAASAGSRPTRRLWQLVAACARGGRHGRPAICPAARSRARRTSRSRSRFWGRSSRCNHRTRSRSAATACSSSTAPAAACCCRRWPRNGGGRRAFLEQTCRKAGVRPDSWQQGATVWRFEAEVFGETERLRAETIAENRAVRSDADARAEQSWRRPAVRWMSSARQTAGRSRRPSRFHRSR